MSITVDDRTLDERCTEERFVDAIRRGDLLGSWLPALDGVEERLRAGGLVADVGCGHGATTIAMAVGYPRSAFTGYDPDLAAIQAARACAVAAGAGPNLRFEAIAGIAIPAYAYDLVTTFDAVADVGDPVAVARHVRSTLADDGVWMLLEPRARLLDVLAAAGFSSVRAVVETPFDVVLEARP